MLERASQAATQSLIERARAGERPAFDALFARVAERLALFVRLRTGSRLAAELEVVDVLQETYLQAWKSLASYDLDGERALLAWLCRVAENRLRDLAQLSAAAKRRPAGERVDIERVLGLARESATGPLTAAARAEARQQLSAGLEDLEDDERRVLLLRYFQERELEDIAAEVGRSVSSVRRLLARGLERLGRRLPAGDGA